MLRPNARASFEHLTVGNKSCNLTASHLSSGSNGRRKLRLRWLRKWRNHTIIHKSNSSLVGIQNEARQETPIPAMQWEAFFFEGESIIQVPLSGLSYLRGAGRAARQQLDANVVCGVKRAASSLRKHTTANDCLFVSPHCDTAIVLSRHPVTPQAAFELLACTCSLFPRRRNTFCNLSL